MSDEARKDLGSGMELIMFLDEIVLDLVNKKWNPIRVSFGGYVFRSRLCKLEDPAILIKIVISLPNPILLKSSNFARFPANFY